LNMRGALVALLVFGWLPIILFKPHVGVLVWNWVSHMIPHEYTYNFARTFPFLVLVFGATVVGLVINKDKKGIPPHPIVFAIIIYWFWALVTSVLAIEPRVAQPVLVHISKVLVFALISMAVMQSPNRLKAFIWVMAASLGYIAIKGGLFTLITGGVARVQGAGGMMEDNNQLAMAMAMLIPLGIYLAEHPPHSLLKWPLRGCAVLVPIAALGTQSRGGFVAVMAVLGMLVIKSKHRFKLIFLLILLGGIGWNFAPESYKNRIASTEGAAEEDDSFRGRLGMWKFSTNLVADHPIEGGGFDVFYVREAQDRYMPPGFPPLAPHSIYFEVLGEHGYVGLVLFLTMIFTGWFSGASQAKRYRKYQETIWVADLCACLQLSLVAYCVGGLTVNIATFDILYHFLAVIVMCHVVGEQLMAGTLTQVGTGEKLDARAAAEKWTPSDAAAPQHTR
jgi:probable O-glycosylation ligase (exosortase A-associated)